MTRAEYGEDDMKKSAIFDLHKRFAKARKSAKATSSASSSRFGIL